MPMQKESRNCLDKLASAAPKTKAAHIRSLLPGIEAALNSQQSLKDIWAAMGNEGLQMSYRVFHKTVSRCRKMKKPTAASSWGKQDESSEALGLQETKVVAVEERGPFANLKRLENRPGFHWRGEQDLKTLLHGTDVSTDDHN